MGIQNLTDEIILVTLPKNPHVTGEVERATRTITSNGGCHAIIDFSCVDMIASSTITDLIILETQQQEAGRQLILCCVPPKIHKLLTHAGMQSFFQLAESEFAALQLLTVSECHCG